MKTFKAGEVLTASDLNNNFTQASGGYTVITDDENIEFTIDDTYTSNTIIYVNNTKNITININSSLNYEIVYYLSAVSDRELTINFADDITQNVIGSYDASKNCAISVLNGLVVVGNFN